MQQKAVTSTLQLTSSVFEPNGKIPEKYTCNGLDINPPLWISKVPEAAKSLVLIMDDPDAPQGIFTHWLMWNIDPKTTEIGENSVPQRAIEGTNSFGNIGYRGPCPPHGTHRYQFHLYALDTSITLTQGAKINELEHSLKALESNILAKTTLIGKYSALNP